MCAGACGHYRKKLDHLKLTLRLVVSYLLWGWEQKPGPLQEESMLLTLSHLSSPWCSFSSLEPYPILESDVNVSALGCPHQICTGSVSSRLYLSLGQAAGTMALGVISETPELQRPCLLGCHIASICSISPFTTLVGSRHLLVLSSQ